MDLAAPVVQDGRGPPWGPDLDSGTPRPGRLGSWPEAARSGSGMASPGLRSPVLPLKEMAFPSCACGLGRSC